jgi:death-on-curing protein
VKTAPQFLSVDDIRRLHRFAIEDQGGDASLRDSALLESAVAMPRQQFGGDYLHPDIPSMAAAYAFHICKNHPFVDGNKRAGVAAMVVFLSDNGWKLDVLPDEAEPVVLRLASGKMSKPEFEEWARRHARELPKMELRDFFSRINPAEFNRRFLSLLPAETGAKVGELQRRASEAAIAMPLLSNLMDEQAASRDAQDEREWERITMLAVGILTLHALAEDMGYEW